MRRTKKKVKRLRRKSEGQTNVNKRLEGYKRGFEEGYKQGLQAGNNSFDSFFEGTSIIVPSDNEVESVKRCIESIVNYTDLSYEIIVVDNNSSDGIENYLKHLNGMVRYRILPQNQGLAGALNRGLMMAKGTTILLLSSNVVCTDNWLHNMLNCLQSNSNIGMVGAVTNGMNGGQRYDFDHTSMESMHEFATINNVSDPARWSFSEYLSPKCLLFSRHLLEKVGFLDEGCLIGPFVEEDYFIRVKLQGLSLVCAGDAFVHFASGDERLPSSEEEAENQQGLLYFTRKWNNPYELLYSSAKDQDHSTDRSGVLTAMGWDGPRLGETAFYPQAIAVKGLTEKVYWIEDGMRRAIKGNWRGPVIPLPQIDLWQWTIGPALNEEEAQLKLNLVHGDGQHSILHGTVCVIADGGMYYMESGMKRAIVSRFAAEAWILNERLRITLSDSELLAVPDGLPIIGPVNLRQAL
ncbi:glycosyltransferase family 2 protein [Paenibacillus sp. LPE1-1-1.1]|uniref:glycosyltransferase family 2 protein n=1 Tax=Paenibacillus sp. LPE1-1-1.1 TaxID=3135230 RepID=UPI003438AB91